MDFSDVLYVSEAKLKRWVRPAGRLRGVRPKGSLSAELSFAGVKLGAAADAPPLRDADESRLAAAVARAHDVYTWLNQSQAPVLDYTDPLVRAGRYAFYDGYVRYGRMHRDSGARGGAAVEIIVFISVGGSVDVILTGWRGHMTDSWLESDRSQRMGSGTEAVTDLFEQIVQAEQAGAMSVPDELLQGARTGAIRGGRQSLLDMTEDVLGVAQMHLPAENSRPVRGFFEVLATFSAEDRRSWGRDRSLVVGTPIFLERAIVQPEGNEMSSGVVDSVQGDVDQPGRSWWQFFLR